MDLPTYWGSEQGHTAPLVCHSCNRRIQAWDAITVVPDPDRPLQEGARTPAHVACTSDGVQRWLREGRPHSDPLAWDRHDRPSWAHRPARPVGHAHPSGRVRPTRHAAPERVQPPL